MKKIGTIFLIVTIVSTLIYMYIFIKKRQHIYRENTIKAHIVDYMKYKYDVDCEIEDSKEVTTTRWTNGLSKSSRELYECYVKGNPELEFKVEYINGEITRDNYHYGRIRYEIFEYYRSYFEAISDKYYIEVDVQFLEKGIRNPNGNFLYQVDSELYNDLLKKSFQELITDYQDYLEIAFMGRINTNKPKKEIEEKIMKLVKNITETNVLSFGMNIGFIQYEKDIPYKRNKVTTLWYGEFDKEFRGKIDAGDYIVDKEKFIDFIKEEWKWQ